MFLNGLKRNIILATPQTKVTPDVKESKKAVVEEPAPIDSGKQVLVEEKVAEVAEEKPKKSRKKKKADVEE